MKMNDVSFDPQDTQASINPSFPSSEPYKADAWQFIGRVAYLDPRRVRPMKDQPRTDAEHSRIAEIAESINTAGQQESAIAFPIDDPNFDVELKSGHRRRLACLKNGCMLRVEIRAVPQNQLQRCIEAVAGNCNREDLSIRDTVRSVAILLSLRCTHRKVAALFGKKPGWVNQYARLVTLDPAVLSFFEKPLSEQVNIHGRKLRRDIVLPISYAVEVARLPREKQLAATQAILEEVMDIKSARHFIRQRLSNLGINRDWQCSPEKRMKLFERAVIQFEQSLDEYARLPYETILAVHQKKDDFQRSILERRIRFITTQLPQIADAIRPRDMWCTPLREWLQQQTAAWEASGKPLQDWMNEQPKFQERAERT